MATKVYKELALTPASVWRDMQVVGEAVELPSGLVVRLRPVSMERLFTTGKIPDALTPIVASIISTGSVEFKDPMNDATAMLNLKRILCSASILFPEIVDVPDYDRGQISYFDLSSEDSEFIMSWAQRPQKDLSTFRTK